MTAEPNSVKPPPAAARRWAQLPELGSTTALRLIHWIGVRIGRGAARCCLYPISLYFLLTATEARRGSVLYLRRLWGRQPRWYEVLRHIHCFAATILDRVYLLAGQFERFDIRVHGGELVQQRVAAGQGCLLLGSHLGSFEVLRVLGVTARRFPLKILMDVEHNPKITRYFSALNPAIAASIMPLRGPETLLQVKDYLDQGYLIGTLGDRVSAGDKTVQCRFLEADTRFPTGPVLLAALCQCPVILFFGLYRGGNRYDIYFELLAETIPPEARRRPEALRHWTRRYVERLEYHTRQAPYNWFNFYEYWDTTEPSS